MIHEVIKDRFYIDADNLDEEFSIIHVLGDLPYPDEDNYRIDNEYYRYLQDNLNKGQHLFELQVGSLEEEVELLKYFKERGWKKVRYYCTDYIKNLHLDQNEVRFNRKYFKVSEVIEKIKTMGLKYIGTDDIDEGIHHGSTSPGIKILVNRKDYPKFKRDIENLKELKYKTFWNIGGGILSHKKLLK